MGSRPDRRHVAGLIGIAAVGRGLRILCPRQLSRHDELALTFHAIGLLRLG